VGASIAIIVPDDRDWEVREILRRAAAGERVERYETLRRRRDGSRVEVSLTVSPVRDDRGEVVAASVIARDVSERGVAEARRSAMVQAALDAIVTMDGDGRIVEFNPAAEQVFGYTNDEVAGRLVAETLVPPDHRAAHRRGLAHYLQTGTGLLIGQQTDIIAMRSDGSVFPAEIAITELPLEGHVAFTAYIRDVSLRREAERALAESEQHRRKILASMLQAQEDERSRIATELHDDTVQVMTAALLSMDRLAMVARRHGVENIESAVMHTRATLEEATERARRLMFELRPAILHEQGLRAAIGVLAEQTAREAGATARLLCRPVRYDHTVEELVYRTAQEALANVRKHANATAIVVSIWEDAAGMLVGEIHDDGQGFDQDEVRSRPNAALHLGVESLVERVRVAGGDATITTGVGEGTRVRFSIPLATDRATR
jgi:PAS domain S-box-containing protein